MGVLPGVSVVVPVYNSEDSLPELIRRVSKALAEETDDFEVILVNDGSRDNSWTMIEQLASEHSFIRGIDLMRNYGQHNALLVGIRAATFDVTMTLDDDLQNPPEEMGALLAGLSEGVDLVYGTPAKLKHGLWRTLASKVTKIALQGAMGAETARKVSAYRAFRTTLRRAFSEYRSPFVSIDVLLTWGTTKIKAVDVRHDERAHGESNYTLGKLVRHAFNMMTGFSTVPLQIASIIGFAFTLFGIAILGLVLVRYFSAGVQVPGFFFLTSVISIFAGAQLFALGIIGEYLTRIHFRTMDRPAYSVRDSIGGGGAPDAGLPE